MHESLLDCLRVRLKKNFISDLKYLYAADKQDALSLVNSCLLQDYSRTEWNDAYQYITSEKECLSAAEARKKLIKWLAG